jgi:hypothetical protein
LTYVWGAQLVEGTNALDYQRTETRLNIPRLDYSNGSCPSILVEPQRTNVSNYIESGTGGFNAAAVTSATSILGLRAFKVTANNGLFGDAPYVLSNSEFQANTAYTLSYYTDFSQCTGFSVECLILGFFPIIGYAKIIIDKITKTITTENIGGIWTINSFSATQINGEIYKISFTATPNSTTVYGSRTYIYSQNSTADFAGIQLEVGSYGTSFINKPTSASVTRNADVISKTGISSLIGQTEGTLFYDLDLNSRVSFNYILLGNLTAYIGFYFTESNMGLEVVLGGNQASIVYSNTSTGRFKIGIAYKQNDFVMYINGNLIGTDTSGNVPTCSEIDLTFNQKNSIGFNTVALWKTRLTNDQLAQLTTI